MRNWPGDAFHNKHRHRRNITFFFFHLFNYNEELFLWIQIFKYALCSLVPFLFICLRLNSLNLFVLILTHFLRVMIMMRVIQFWKCLCSSKTTHCICSCMICIVYIVYLFGLILWWWWWEWFWSVYAAVRWKEDNGVGSFSEAAGLEKLGEGAGGKGEGPAAYG